MLMGLRCEDSGFENQYQLSHFLPGFRESALRAAANRNPLNAEEAWNFNEYPDL